MSVTKEKVPVERMNGLFARTMEIGTLMGLVLMVMPGIAYLAGLRGQVSVSSATGNWDKPASKFWEATQGIHADGYSWFLDNLTHTDCWSVVGIAFLALVPMLSTIAAMWRADRKYLVGLGVLVVELVVAVVLPAFTGLVGR